MTIPTSTRGPISEAEAEAFRQDGVLVLRDVIAPDELAALQAETAVLVDRAARRDVEGLHEDAASDIAYRRHPETGVETPFRIEYILEKSPAARALLGHPVILHSIETLQGPNLIPTWDSMVFKMEGAGAEISWHRDGTLIPGYRPDGSQSINVDVYLDESDLSNCLWGFRASNHWTDERVAAVVDRLNGRPDGEAFQTSVDGMTAEPLPMRPGDVILHSTLAVHGSPAARSSLRRVIYLEFRPAEVEAAVGPHAADYIPLKQGVLLDCLAERATRSYAADETPYRYAPDPRFALPDRDAAEHTDRTYRYPHQRYWRAATPQGDLP